MITHKKIFIICCASFLSFNVHNLGSINNIANASQTQNVKITYVYGSFEQPKNIQSYFDINKFLNRDKNNKKLENNQIKNEKTTRKKSDHHAKKQSTSNNIKDKRYKKSQSKSQSINTSSMSNSNLINKVQMNQDNKDLYKDDVNSNIEVQYETFMYQGVILWNNYYFTYASQSVAPGNGLNIPGRHVENGYIVDKDGYIVLGAQSSLRGQVFNTPFGKKGKVYDAGPTHSHHLNVYVQ